MESKHLDLIDRASYVERLINPIEIEGILKDASMETIGEAFHQVRGISQAAWMSMAVCVGIAQEKAGEGDRVAGDLGILFQLHKSRVSRLGTIYREILKPRFEKLGTNARFYIQEISYYDIAADASLHKEESALEILESAEEAKLNNPHYTVRKFKKELNVDYSMGKGKGALTLAREFGNQLVNMSDTPSEVVETFITRMSDKEEDIEAWYAISKDVYNIIQRITRRINPRSKKDLS